MPFLLVFRAPSIIRVERSTDNRGGEGERREEGRDPFFSTGRSNLGRAKQRLGRETLAGGVGGVRKGRDDAPGREIFGGREGVIYGGGSVFGWALLGRYRVVSSRVGERNHSCFLLSLSLFFLFSWEISTFLPLPCMFLVFEGFVQRVLNIESRLKFD